MNSLKLAQKSPRGGLLHDKYNMGAVNLIWLNRYFLIANYAILIDYILFLFYLILSNLICMVSFLHLK